MVNDSPNRCPRPYCAGRLIANEDGVPSCLLCSRTFRDTTVIVTVDSGGQLVEQNGRQPAPREPTAQRLMELAENARARLIPVKDISEWVGKLDRAIDAFLCQLIPWLLDSPKIERLEGDVILSPTQLKAAMEWTEARNIVLEALMTTANSSETWAKAMDGLGRRFPDWAVAPCEADVATIKSAYITLCEAWKGETSANAASRRYWREAARITGRVVNRGRKSPRLGRRLLVEEMVFNYLWLGTRITDDDMEQGAKGKHAALDSALAAIDEALRLLPPRRTLRQLIKVAYRKAGGSGGTSLSVHSEYQAFRRLIYRHFDEADRKWLMTVSKEPYAPEVAYVPNDPTWSGLVEELRRMGIEVVDSPLDLG